MLHLVLQLAWLSILVKDLTKFRTKVTNYWGQFVKSGGSVQVKSATQGIEHRTTRPASPYTNGFVERFHRTIKDEFFAKVFREKRYSSLDELQSDLDQFLKFYNEERTHTGYRCQGETPMQTLKSQLEAPKSEVSDESSEPMAA